MVLVLASSCGGAASSTPAVAVAEVPPVPQSERSTVPEAASARAKSVPDEDGSMTGAEGERGWLGVELEAVTAPEPGVRVLRVIPRSPANRAGIEAGDVIQRIDNLPVSQPSEVVATVSQRGSGARVGLQVKRAGKDRLFAVPLGTFPEGDELVRMTFVDQPAPALAQLEVARGSITPTLGANRGKVMVIEFWAPWCVACRALIPHMNQWQAQYGARGLRVIGITNERVPRAAAYSQQFGMDFSILADPSGATSRNYGASAIPAVYVIDRRGTVRDVMVGYDGKKLAELDQLVQRLVAEP